MWLTQTIFPIHFGQSYRCRFLPAAWVNSPLPMNIPHAFPILWAAISHFLKYTPHCCIKTCGFYFLPPVFFPEPPETRKVGFSLECFSFFKVMILFNAILLGVEIDIAAKRSQNDMPAWFGIAARTPDDSFFGGPREGRRENGGPIVSLLVGEKRGCLRTCHHQNTKRS